MKIFADFHHSGLAHGLVLTLDRRLNHEVWFPDTSFADHVKQETQNASIMLPCLPSWLIGMGDATEPYPYLCGIQQFMDTDWDAVIISRIETQDVMRGLLAKHPHGAKVKVIGQAGNECTSYDWGFVKNFMSSEYLSYLRAPAEINKIWYSQEISPVFMSKEYCHVTPATYRRVHTYVNCWPTFDQPWRWDSESSGWSGKCPHCDNLVTDLSLHPLVSPYGLWQDAKEALPDREFREYGIACRLGCIPEVQLPVEYKSSAVTVHMKTYDGYGFSMLQSIACGRPVIVPRRFHKYRTASRYLIPNLTCFEVEWTVQSIVEAIRYITEDVAHADGYGIACHAAGQALFNWPLEAHRVWEFLGKLR